MTDGPSVSRLSISGTSVCATRLGLPVADGCLRTDDPQTDVSETTDDPETDDPETDDPETDVAEMDDPPETVGVLC